MLSEVVNFTGYHLIGRTLTVSQWSLHVDAATSTGNEVVLIEHKSPKSYLLCYSRVNGKPY